VGGDVSPAAAALFDGSDGTLAMLRSTDWASTPLGPVDGWPAELQAAVRTVLPSRVPMVLWWGPRLTQIYNDAFTPLIGDKHPRAIGQDAADCYREAWPELAPLAESVLAGGGATYSRDLYLPYARHGYVEETYWTFSYSPVRVSDGVGGVFIACIDTTSRVLAERRLRVLHEMGGVSTAEARNAADACRIALRVLTDNRRDVPSRSRTCSMTRGRSCVRRPPSGWRPMSCSGGGTRRRTRRAGGSSRRGGPRW
jgi:hypothetical protein